jgi:hypothetical protein
MGGGAGCAPLPGARERGVASFSGGRTGTHWAGAVPDGVAQRTDRRGRQDPGPVGPANGRLEWFDAAGRLIKRLRWLGWRVNAPAPG